MFHRTNFGSFGTSLPCDIGGYVPEESDGPFDFNIDHGTERTHNPDGSLTEYGQWWEEEGFPEWRDKTVKQTREAQAKLEEWRNK